MKHQNVEQAPSDPSCPSQVPVLILDEILKFVARKFIDGKEYEAGKGPSPYTLANAAQGLFWLLSMPLYCAVFLGPYLYPTPRTSPYTGHLLPR